MTTAREPNIIWAGEGNPPDFYTDGREVVLVPKGKAAFHTEDPLRLVRLSGGAFKLYLPKGEPAPGMKTPAGKPKTKRS